MDPQLLLARANDGQPAVEGPLPLAPARKLPIFEQPPASGDLLDITADLNDLERQRWALVVPEGEPGRQIQGRLAQLVHLRADRQGAHVQVFTTPPVLDGEQARKLVESMYPGSTPEREHPRYVLLVGRPEEVPPALEHALREAGTALVGRVAFEQADDYEAYGAKVVESEGRRPAGSPRALVFAVDDGTVAVRYGRELLVEPLLARCKAERLNGYLQVSDLVEIHARCGDGDPLLKAAAGKEPAVLFTLSHGVGAPQGGWRDAATQRHMQGCMSLGNGCILAPEEVRSVPFLPGGAWLYFACFGGGTPAESVYLPWLALLDQVPEGIQAATPLDGRPFVGALAQAALANPQGPVAVIAHDDLAWAYSFHDPVRGEESPGRFVAVLAKLLEGNRAGAALAALKLAIQKVDAEVRRCGQRRVAAWHRKESPPPEVIDSAHLWMTRNDLANFVVLGDPAARLPVFGTGGVKHSS